MPNAEQLLGILFDAGLLALALIVLTRLVGLRSFSKMSGYDFAITVAIGSILASVVVGTDTHPVTGLAALGALFAVQTVLSRVRVGSPAAERAMDNAPLLLMEGETIFDENLRAAKMTRADLMGKLREANCLSFASVNYVVFEPTGDVSVLHGEGPVDDALLAGVRTDAP